jgi:hypothetical protein
MLGGCLMDSPEPGEPETLGANTSDRSNPVEPENLGTVTPSVRDGVRNCIFRATLTGDQEVPPVKTDASGQAVFRLDLTGAEPELDFVLNVSKITGVTQAHIHQGAKGVNGPILAFLFHTTKPTGVVNGILAKDAVQAGDLVGPLFSGSLNQLIEKMNAGLTYVNVHTTANPNGEIRGQIEPVGECILKKPCDTPPDVPDTEIPK